MTNPSNQYYLRARYYNQATGRFTQMDTWMGRLTLPATLNMYSYVLGDPANGIDPSGHISLMDFSVGLNLRAGQSVGTSSSLRLTVRKIGKQLACIAVEEMAVGAITEVLSSGVYIFQDGSRPYVGQSTDIEKRLNQHKADGLRRVDNILARLGIEGDRNDRRLIEQFFIEFLGGAGDNGGTSNSINSVAQSPKSPNSKNLRKTLRNGLDICD